MIKIILISVFALVLFGCETQGGGKEFLIYPTDVIPKISRSEKGGIISISFETNDKYPSLRILEFYEKEMEHIGMKPMDWFRPKSGNRSWKKFSEEKKDGSIQGVFQYLAAWVDGEKKRMAVLSLRYEGENIKSPVDAPPQRVNFQVMPYIDPEKFDERQ